MKIVNLLLKKLSFLICLNLFLICNSNSEIIIFKKCENDIDGFIKNNYTLDLDRLLMIRNYTFTEKTFEKYRFTDLSVKKKNMITRNIYKKDKKIFTEKIGYPQFYTQLIFERKNPIIQIKTVINNETGVSKIYTCRTVSIFDEES